MDYKISDDGFDVNKIKRWSDFYDIKYAKEPEIEFNDNGNFNFILTPKLIVNRPHYDIHCFRYDVFDLCIRITSNNKFKLRLLETYVSRRSKFEYKTITEANKVENGNYEIFINFGNMGLGVGELFLKQLISIERNGYEFDAEYRIDKVFGELNFKTTLYE